MFMMDNGMPLSGHPLAQRLSTAGDGTGTVNMNAAAPSTYYIRPETNQVYAICSLRLTIADTGTFDTTNFGATAGLAVGVFLHHTMGGRGMGNSVFNFHAGLTVLNNGLLIDAGWERIDPQAAVASTGAGDDWQTHEWDILGRLGCPIIIRRTAPDGTDNDPAIEFITGDNMAALASMYVTAYGFIL